MRCEFALEPAWFLRYVLKKRCPKSSTGSHAAFGVVFLNFQDPAHIGEATLIDFTGLGNGNGHWVSRD